ncbi:MAG: filamentous hemagglutinin N-terminal domain-containing protein, partial [bacterium]
MFQKKKFIQRIKVPLCRMLLYVMLLSSVQGLAADIVVQDPAIFVDQAASGTDIIYITEPNTDQLSYNAFNRFNVDESGAVINNSVNGSYSHLLGQMEGNPFLQGKEANAVVFDVLGGQQSQVNGLMEMLGRRADFILSNQHGISVDGAGFLNMSKVLLTTGRALDETKRRYGVRQGELRIGQNGLYAGELDHLDLAARRIHIEGMLAGADTLRVIAGMNELELAGAIQTVDIHTTATSHPQQKLAIDASIFGAVQAGSIYIVSTEHGLGVNIQAPLHATEGELKVKSAGDVSMNSAIAETRIEVEADQYLQLSGQGNELAILSANRLQLESGAGQDSQQVVLQAQHIDSHSRGHIHIDESLLTGETISLASDDGLKIQHSFLQASEDLSALALDYIELDNSLLHARQLQINSPRFLQTEGELNSQTLSLSGIAGTALQQLSFSGQLQSVEDLHLVADQMQLQSGILASQGNIDLQAITLSQHALVNAGEGLTLKAEDLNNSGLVQAGQTLDLDTTDLNNSGLIQSAEGLNLETINFENSGLVQAGQSLEINSDTVANQGQFSANQLELAANHVHNQGQVLAEQMG